MIPEASVYHLGIFREEKSLHPIIYYDKLPRQCNSDICIVLDPMIATAGTAIAAVQTLKEWGVKEIHFVSIIGSEKGVDTLITAHPDISIHVAAIDKELSPSGFIVPGFGDAGDRLFNH